MKHKLAFIGFGEAGFNIALGLGQEGLRNIVAYDINQNDPTAGALIRKRAAEADVQLMPSASEAYGDAEYIISMTSPAYCVSVARSVIPYLKAGQTYCDLNSASPEDMKEVDRIPRNEGVGFVDAGVLGSVPKTKHKTKMLLTGSGAEGFCNTFRPYGMILEVLDAPVGSASALKLLKSIINKGLPQLFIEAYTAAAAYGVYDKLLSMTKNTFKEQNFEEWCNEYLYHTLVHAERRGAEVGNCVEVIEAAGMDASMCKAAQHKLQQLARYDYKNRITDDNPPGLRECVEMILNDKRKENAR